MVTLLVALCSSCGTDLPRGGREIAGGNEEIVRLVDSTVLEENDSVPMGGFTTFVTRDRHGQVYVTDITNRRVVVYARTGRLVRYLGTDGEGPGEFRLPAAVIPDAPSRSVAVMDMNRGRLLVFDDSTGAFQREVEVPFRHVGPHVLRLKDQVVLAAAMSLEPLARWIPATDSFALFGAKLSSGVAGWQSVAMAAGVPGVAGSDSLFAVWQPALGLDLYDATGALLQSVALPRRRRRGEGDALIAEQRLLRQRRSDSVVISSALGIARLPDGKFVIVAQDADRVTQNGRNARETNIRPFIILVDLAGRRACADAPVPFETDVSSLPMFNQDTLFMLARRVTAEETVRSVVMAYVIDDSSCTWDSLPGL